MIRWLVAASTAALLSASSAVPFSTAALAQAPALHVAGQAATRAATPDVATFAPVFHRGHPAYPINALLLLGASVEPDGRGARVLLLGDTLRFDALSPIFFAGASPIQLAAPVYREGGVMYVPRQLFTEWLPGRFRTEISLRADTLRLTAAGAAAVAAMPEVAAGARAAPGPAPAPDAATAVDRVVVIDPGHGGRDPGKIGPNGLREKDITLAVGLRLASILRDRGYEVHLTRSEDVLIPLAERPRMANRWRRGRPALFMSLHANSAGSHVQGFETFFLAEPRTADERRVAEMENAAVRFENGDDAAGTGELDLILNNLRNTFYLRASNDLAEVVQLGMAGFHPGPNRGVKQAGFRVLVGALMPAVLVEMAFISNPHEARLLGTAAFRDRIATALADAVDGFFASHAHLLVTERAP